MAENETGEHGGTVTSGTEAFFRQGTHHVEVGPVAQIALVAYFEAVGDKVVVAAARKYIPGVGHGIFRCVGEAEVLEIAHAQWGGVEVEIEVCRCRNRNFLYRFHGFGLRLRFGCGNDDLFFDGQSAVLNGRFFLFVVFFLVFDYGQGLDVLVGNGFSFDSAEFFPCLAQEVGVFLIRFLAEVAVFLTGVFAETGVFVVGIFAVPACFAPGFDLRTSGGRRRLFRL